MSIGIENFIQNQVLLPRLKQNGVLVVYDLEEELLEFELDLE